MELGMFNQGMQRLIVVAFETPEHCIDPVNLQFERTCIQTNRDEEVNLSHP